MTTWPDNRPDPVLLPGADVPDPPPPDGILGVNTLGNFILGGFPGRQFVADRLLYQMESGPMWNNGHWRAFLTILQETAALDVAFIRDQLMQAYDLDTAVGVQLDAIGSIVLLPRQGFDDERYRTFLRIQTELLLSALREDAEWTGTGPNILRIARTFVGPDTPPIVLRNLPPYTYSLAIPLISIEELGILAHFLCRASYAGVLGITEFALDENSLYDSETAGDPIDGAGVYASEWPGSPIADTATYGTIVALNPETTCESFIEGLPDA